MSVAVIGGGLAGLAAAVGLSDAGIPVELFEARSRLGGRATSFRDPATGELVDNCQHVSMACCTNLADFCRRTGISQFFRRDRVLNFIGPSGHCYRFQASRWLPAPLHVAPAFWGLKYLSLRDRFRIARALWRLLRTPLPGRERPGEGRPQVPDETVQSWLVRHNQSPAAIRNFWSVVLVSALGETCDRASLAAARKVFVDGFLSARSAYELDIPQAPLGELYGQRLESWLAQHHVKLRLATAVQIVTQHESGFHLQTAQDSAGPFRFMIVAVPWKQAAQLLSPQIRSAAPGIEAAAAIDASPITGVHLWFDRPIIDLPHAVLVGRLGQWIFNRGWRPRVASDRGHGSDDAGHYYQIVISASRDLAGLERVTIVEQLCQELAAIWPAASQAKLLNWRVVTEPAAVFSVQPGLETLRPQTVTAVPGLLLAGDWTSTGWPATMEGAVCSGYRAAEAVLESLGQPRRLIVPDLPKGWLSRLLC